MNWTGHVTAAPRSDLAELLKRDETARTGIYILLGDDPDSVVGSQAYIGEGDDVRERLRVHARSEEAGGKDFWSQAIVLTSKDANLTKAHVRYLESNLIRIALAAGRSKLRNGTQPPPTMTLPEADRSDMDYYIDQAMIILPVLGVNLLRRPARDAVETDGQESSKGRLGHLDLVLETRKDGTLAHAREADGEFTVLAGSKARISWGAGEHNYKLLRQKLEQESIIPVSHETGWRMFAKDYVFESPSAAAAIILGRAANGRKEWRIAADPKCSCGDWQVRGLVDDL